MALASSLRLQILPAAQLARQPAEWLRGVLGVACYSTAPQPDLAALGLPLTLVQVQALHDENSLCEVWLTDAPLRQGQHGQLHWRCSDAVLFGAMAVDARALHAELAVEPEMAHAGAHADRRTNTHAQQDGTQPALQRAAEQAYNDLFAALQELGFPHLLRVWNHIPDINRESAGMEHYRLFNIGRQEAFLAHGRQVRGASVPSASALGAQSEAPLVVYCLALRQPPLAIENPRQLSAYHYPADYGPRTPTFSRANLVCIGGRLALFISGTASIVGHRSLHLGDVIEQTRETLRNIEAVLQQTREHGGCALTLQQLHYKVYVRHVADLPAIRAELQRVMGSEVTALYLQADVCRADLLVEIEAVALPTTQEFAC
jgi:enamine deaminase RidA (YjgF/YER057c/UK114 family)